MSKLPIFEHFLSVGKSQAQTQVVFQANFFLLNWAPELHAHRRRLHPELCARGVKLVAPREQLGVGLPLHLAVVEEGAARQKSAVEHRRVDHVHALVGPDSIMRKNGIFQAKTKAWTLD